LIIDWFPKEAKMRVVGRSEDGAWLAVALPGYNQVGWVLATTVSFDFDINQIPVPTVPATPTASPTAILVAVVASPAANVRTGPGTNYLALTSLTEGAEVQVTGRSADGDWLAVWLPDMQLSGWMALSTLNVDFEVELLEVIAAPPSPTPRPYTPPTPTEENGSGNPPADTPIPTTAPTTYP
jgi:uncharacterized protein YraI